MHKFPTTNSCLLEEKSRGYLFDPKKSKYLQKQTRTTIIYVTTWVSLGQFKLALLVSLVFIQWRYGDLSDFPDPQELQFAASALGSVSRGNLPQRFVLDPGFGTVAHCH